MASDEKKVRALGLSSGGLDSILSALVLREHGIDVEWISFETPFFSADKARAASEMTGIPLTVSDITGPYLEMLKDPNCGYGRNMNPCLDCHALMFRQAGKRLAASAFDFLFSGEVLGQRPMSQTRSSLRYVEKRSGHAGYIVRPLSIQRLPETVPERKGWVRRESLYGITGRGRKQQIALAAAFGITDYPNPAGGCLLTDPKFSHRLRDLFAHHDPPSVNAIHLLKSGRHFRFSPGCKVIVGRNKRDNAELERLFEPQRNILIRTRRVPAPVALLDGAPSTDEIRTAAGLCIGYSKTPRGTAVDVTIITPAGRTEQRLSGISPQEVRHLMM